MKSLIVITLMTLTIDSTPDLVLKDSSIQTVVIIPRVTIIWTDMIDMIEMISGAGTVKAHSSLSRGIKIKIWADRLSIGWWCL